MYQYGQVDESETSPNKGIDTAPLSLKCSTGESQKIKKGRQTTVPYIFCSFFSLSLPSALSLSLQWMLIKNIS